MAELFLKFEDRVLQELLLSGGTVTIGRQPDNNFCVDNPAVSGHHATVFAEGDHYVIQDAESFNGTYVNGQRISRAELKDGDNVTIGKHTIEFRDEVRQQVSAQQTAVTVDGQLAKPRPPQLDRTVVLDTAEAKEMVSKLAAAASSAGSVTVNRVGFGQNLSPVNVTRVVHQTIGTLTIVKGRTDQPRYVLTSKLTLIGRSKMAGIRLKRWFAPQVAASIYRAED
jgi:pSer/pThr/pTyr-binding forkhead associated (FHA) protein